MFTYYDNASGTVIRYRLTRSVSTVPSKERWIYGIRAVMAVNGKDVCEKTVENAFCIRKDAEAFMKRLADNGVEPYHLEDVVYDYLLS